MQSQNRNKNKKNLTNLKKATVVKFRLAQNNITQKDIAYQLNLSPAAVCQVINGLRRSQRIEECLKNNTGVSLY